MKAVATMTPDPKYLTPEKTHSGTPVSVSPKQRSVSKKSAEPASPTPAQIPAETYGSAVTA